MPDMRNTRMARLTSNRQLTTFGSGSDDEYEATLVALYEHRGMTVS